MSCSQRVRESLGWMPTGLVFLFLLGSQRRSRSQFLPGLPVPLLFLGKVLYCDQVGGQALLGRVGGTWETH